MSRDRGSVTAEFAVALPAVVLVLGLAIGALTVGSQAVRLQDAAGLAARGLARGEPAAEMAGMVGALVPGASLARSEHAALVCAVVTARAAGVLSGIELRAESCALAER